MSSPDIKDIPPAKKAKLEEITSNPQDGTNNEYHDLPEPIEYCVFVRYNFVEAHCESGGDLMSLYCKIMRDAGCPESKIDPFYGAVYFLAKLTPAEVKKLSDLDSVLAVYLSVMNSPVYQCNQPHQNSFY